MVGNNSDPTRDSTRRRFIQTTAAATLSLPLVGTVAADTERDDHRAVTGKRISLGDAEPVATETDNPGIGPASAVSPLDADVEPPETENLTHVRSWNHSYEVDSSTLPVTRAETNHFIQLFRANGTDDDGRYPYFVWHWSQAEPTDGWLASKIEFQRNMIDVTDERVALTDFEPASTIEREGQEVNLDLGVWGIGGVGNGSLSTSFELYGGRLEPEGEHLQTGDAGSFSAVYEGTAFETMTMNAISLLWTEDGDYTGDDIDWYLDTEAGQA